MIIFENDGEIDPQLISLVGVNVKGSDSAVGFFGTGLKYAIACLARWGESIAIQSGRAEFGFCSEETTIRGRAFGVLVMRSKVDYLRLGFTTELGKQWEPWMAYRELWCNAHDEPAPRVYQASCAPMPQEGITRVMVSGPKIEHAHATRQEFILEGRLPLHVVDGLEIYEGAGKRIFYRGIAVQKLEKPSLYTYNITERLYLSEDREAGSWATDPIIARGLSKIDSRTVVDATLTPPSNSLEARLDYDYAHSPGSVWKERAGQLASSRPLDMPPTVRSKFLERATVSLCPTCQRPMEE